MSIDLRLPDPLAAELVARRAAPVSPLGLYVVAGDDPAAELGRAVERAVFAEVFGNDRELLDTEYGPYEAASTFLVVVDHTLVRTAGAIRLLAPSGRGSKTVNDLEAVWGLNLVDAVPDVEVLVGTGTWDIATLAVAPEYRGPHTGGLVSAALYQAAAALLWANGARWVTTTLDLAVLELIQPICGEPFTAFSGAEPREYLDSPASIPLWCDLPAYEARLRTGDVDRHAFMFHGAGLDGAVDLPAAWVPEPRPDDVDVTDRREGAQP